MTGPGPADPRRHAAWRRDRRRVARELHPDVGGSASAYLLALDAVDEQYGVRADGVGGASLLVSSKWTTTRRALRRRSRAMRGGVRTVRSRLPRGMPGARRYVDL